MTISILNLVRILQIPLFYIGYKDHFNNVVQVYYVCYGIIDNLVTCTTCFTSRRAHSNILNSNLDFE